MDLPMLIKRCLAYGVKILPFQMDTVMEQYDKKRIPDEILSKMKAEDVKTYVEALYLCGCESAGDWTNGHQKLESLGFKKHEERINHRIFQSMVWGE